MSKMIYSFIPFVHVYLIHINLNFNHKDTVDLKADMMLMFLRPIAVFGLALN